MPLQQHKNTMNIIKSQFSASFWDSELMHLNVHCIGSAPIQYSVICRKLFSIESENRTSNAYDISAPHK